MADLSWLANGEARGLNERGPYGTVGECVTAARDAGVRGEVEIWRREGFEPYIDLESLMNDQVYMDTPPIFDDSIDEWANSVIDSERYDAMERELGTALMRILSDNGLAPTFSCWVFQEIVEVK